jgi:UDP:flavonoid glycosyltransferase YjiC (YdhE family)
MRALTAAALCLALVASTASGAHIGVAVFPELGHAFPLIAIVDEAVRQGHTADLYVPSFFFKKCVDLIELIKDKAECVSVGHYDEVKKYDDKFFERIASEPAITTFDAIEEEQNAFMERLMPMLISTAAARATPLDIVLADFGVVQSGLALADKLEIPVVLVWPLTLAIPGNLNPAVPALASALSSTMTPLQRFGNYVLQRITHFTLANKLARTNVARAKHGLAPLLPDDHFERRILLTPSVFGLDASQPLCPNVNAVGFLFRPLPPMEVITPEWLTWLDGCTDGVIYINMGSVAKLPLAWTKIIESAAIEMARGRCVVWKTAKYQQPHLDKAAHPARLRLVSWLEFSPRMLLDHKHLIQFVTHCGQTSVYESLNAGVAMVGVPLFADQPDICARMQDAQLGVVVDKLALSTTALLEASARVFAMNETTAVEMRRLRAVAYMLGGAKAAVRVLERSMLAPASDYVCQSVHLPWYQRYDWDVTLALFVILLALCKLARAVFMAVWGKLKGLHGKQHVE